ncbi:MAG: hypothetical protein ACOYL1_06715 [Chlamydiia bacterium]
MSADAILSGHGSHDLPNLQQSGSDPYNKSSAVDSASSDVSSSMGERVSSLADSIKTTLVPVRHRENNKAIESTNTKLGEFLKTAKKDLKESNPDLAEADIRELVLPSTFSFEGLPVHLKDSIRKSFEQLGEDERTFGALRDIVLENKQEEKSVFSNYGTRLMQLVVDYGTTDFTTTPNELTAKNKTHTIAQIKETFSKNSPVMGALLATGKLLETVYKTTADKGLVGKYNLIDQCAKTFRDKVHDGSSRTITKLAVTLLGTPILLGFKLASKAARIGLGAIAVVVTIGFGAFFGTLLAAGFIIKESVQLVGRKIGCYDNEAKEYCEYKLKEAAEKFTRDNNPENLVDVIKYSAPMSPLCKLDVSRKFVKEMENDTAYQESLKAKKAEKEAARLDA